MVAGYRITAGQGATLVCVRRTTSAAAWCRCRLVRHWRRPGRTIMVADLLPCMHGAPPRGHGMIESAEQGAILEALRACRRNRTNATEELGVGRTTLWVPRTLSYPLAGSRYCRIPGTRSPPPPCRPRSSSSSASDRNRGPVSQPGGQVTRRGRGWPPHGSPGPRDATEQR